MFSESRNDRRRRIGARGVADRLRDRDNATGIGDNSAEIGDDSAGIVDIAETWSQAKLRPEWRLE